MGVSLPPTNSGKLKWHLQYLLVFTTFHVLRLGTYLVETTTFVKTHTNHGKKSHLNPPKKSHVDDMMILNLIKYLVQTRLRLWDIQIINFKPESCPNDLLEICYFYLSQVKSNLDKTFYKVVYHHIIYMCDIFSEFRQFFCRDLHRFSRRLWFPPEMFPLRFEIHIVAIV